MAENPLSWGKVITTIDAALREWETDIAAAASQGPAWSSKAAWIYRRLHEKGFVVDDNPILTSQAEGTLKLKVSMTMDASCGKTVGCKCEKCLHKLLDFLEEKEVEYFKALNNVLDCYRSGKSAFEISDSVRLLSVVDNEVETIESYLKD